MKKKIRYIVVLFPILIILLVSCGKEDRYEENTQPTIALETKYAEMTIASEERSSNGNNESTQEDTTSVGETASQQTTAETEPTTKNEPLTEAESASVGGNEGQYAYVVQPDSYPSTFPLITSAREYADGENGYISFLLSSGATKASTVDEAVVMMKTACNFAKSGINICFAINGDDALKDRYHSMLIDALPKNVALCKYTDMNIFWYSTRYTSNYFGVQFSWWTTEAQEVQINNLVASVAAGFTGTNYDKIKSAHDYICNKTDYCQETYEGRDNNYSAYNALFDGKAVCQGYALSFQKFMDKLGIPCYIAKGNVNRNGTTETHAWNIVYLDGAWYYVDCTWDGQGPDTNYYFFLRGKGYNGFPEWGGLTISETDYGKK